MLKWLTSAVSSVWDTLSGAANDVRTVFDDSSALLGGIVQALDDLFGRQVGTWRGAWSHFNGAMNAFIWTGRALQGIDNGLRYRIIPNSLSWLDGRTHQWVDAKYDPQLAKLFGALAQLFGRVGVLESWRHAFADPTLVNYRQWREWFDTWPQGVLFRWHDYFTNPRDFVMWATPFLTPAIVGYLGQRSEVEVLDFLTREIAFALPAVTDTFLNAVADILEQAA